MKQSNIEICLKKLELLNQLLDWKLNDFDKEWTTSYETQDATIMTAKFVAQLSRKRTDLESHKSRTTEGW